MGSVTLHPSGPGGARTITIIKIDPDAAHIDVTGGDIPSEDVSNVRADPAKLALTCQFDAILSTGDIGVTVRRGSAGNPPEATITISHVILGGGTQVFELQAGDDDALEDFLREADFPQLPAA